MAQLPLKSAFPPSKLIRKKYFVSFDIRPSYQIPGSVTEEQSAAIHNAVEMGINLMADRLRRERGKHLALVAACEFKAAFFRRNGGAV